MGPTWNPRNVVVATSFQPLKERVLKRCHPSRRRERSTTPTYFPPVEKKASGSAPEPSGPKLNFRNRAPNSVKTTILEIRGSCPRGQETTSHYHLRSKTQSGTTSRYWTSGPSRHWTTLVRNGLDHLFGRCPKGVPKRGGWRDRRKRDVPSISEVDPAYHVS